MHDLILIQTEQAHITVGGAGPCEDVDVVPHPFQNKIKSFHSLIFFHTSDLLFPQNTGV